MASKTTKSRAKATAKQPVLEAPTPSWDLIAPNLRLLRDNYEQVIYLFLLPAFCYTLGALLVGNTSHVHQINDFSQRQIYGFVAIGVSLLAALINLAPGFYMQLSAARGEHQTMGQIYRYGLRHFLRVLGLAAVLGVAVIIGLILFIVPGLIILRRYYLAIYYLIDQDMGIEQALRQANQDSQPFSASVWGILGVQAAFLVVGSLLSGIPMVGIIIGTLLSYGALFLPAMRYIEIQRLTPTTKIAFKA